MDYYSMSNSELRELCKQRKIKGYGGKNKDTLLELLGVVSQPPSVKVMKEPDEEVQTDPVEPYGDSPAEPVEPPLDPFDMSGPFIYIFERSSHIEPIQPTPSEKFWKILEILDTTRPHFLLLENVKNIVRHRDGETFKLLKGELEKRGYFHRYRILRSIENNKYIYVTCLRTGETIDETDYYNEKVEEARISVLVSPSVNKKYNYKRESGSWDLSRNESIPVKNTFIRMHVMRNIDAKRGPPLTNSSSLSLRQCFCFDEFSERETEFSE